MISVRTLAAFMVSFALLLVPAFADGNLTVIQGSLSTPYINTLSATPVANMTFAATGGNVNITSILVSLIGTSAYGDISAVIVYNDSDDDGVIDPADIQLGSSSFDATNTSNISMSLFAEAGKTYYILIAFNLSSGATSTAKTGFNLTSNASIYTSTSDNISITGGYIDSELSQVQSVHSAASISPNYVDTNVTNQMFAYTLTKAGNDKFNNISITVPGGYSIINVTNVNDGGTVLRGPTSQNENLTVTFGSSFINVNYTQGYSGNLVINFTVNTSENPLSQVAFNSTITGSNFTSLAPDVSANATSVTTLQMFNVTISTIKAGAYINGTDYWEFNFALGFASNFAGLVQFKMSNWSDLSGSTIALTSGATRYATLRDSLNASNVFNVTNAYDSSVGVYISGSQGTTKNLRLKMVIPAGTPSSKSWWATYSALFRSTP